MRYPSANAIDESSARTTSTSMERDAGSSRMVRATSRNVRAPYFFATSRACSRVVTPRLTTHSPPSTRLRVASHSAQRTSARFAALNTAAASRASKMCAYSGFMLAETRTRSSSTGLIFAAPRRAMSTENSSSISSTMSSALTSWPGVTIVPSTRFGWAASAFLRAWIAAAAGNSPCGSCDGATACAKRNASAIMVDLGLRTSRGELHRDREWQAARPAPGDRGARRAPAEARVCARRRSGRARAFARPRPAPAAAR